MNILPPNLKEDLFKDNQSNIKKVENQIDMIPLETLKVNTQHKNTIQKQKVKELAESIKKHGVLTPLIIRIHPTERGCYEILAGGHRFEGAQLAGITELPCIIKNVDDDTANIYWFDTNLQRNFDTMPKSEIAFGLKKKLEAEKRQGKRTDLLELEEIKGETEHENENMPFELSKRTISRYLRLTELIAELLERLDKSEFGLRSAEKISYINHDKQNLIHLALDETQVELTIQKADLLRNKKDDLTLDLIKDILNEEYEEPKKKQPKNPKEKSIRLKAEELRGIIPDAVLDDSTDDIKDYVMKILKNHGNSDKH